MNQETIAAIATASGTGGIGIIRVSGNKAKQVLNDIIGTTPKERYALYTKFKSKDNKQIIDEGIALYFKGPNSFTGEDVAEFQCHGGSVVLDILLEEILKLGYVRQANPGEFSERAYLNGKIDLTQAEAISDLINATSKQAAISAVNSLQGTFSKLINEINSKIIKLRTYVEATIDFPDESIDFIEDGKIISELQIILDQLDEILSKAKQGVILQEGIKIVIAGKPNAGKSSLLNALCEKDCAIVTNVAGTTRDVIKEKTNIDGMHIHIIDTAGLRDDSDDIVEKIGIEKAWDEIAKANRILFILDVSSLSNNDNDPQQELFKIIKEKTKDAIPFTIIANKTDICPSFKLPEIYKNYPIIKISAKTLQGINDLRNHLKDCAGYKNTSEGLFSARRRHLQSIESAQIHLQKALDFISLRQDIELSAEEMNEAQQNLNEILGRFTSDDLLTEIFNTFCIGK